jgi:BirA family biotin operon repressor/biotin-[acetyl-CoA-carboxylase] ligase
MVREKWRGYLSTLGRRIQVRQGDSVVDGIAEEVNEHGELLLRTSSGELVSITWGDIHYPPESLTESSTMVGGCTFTKE